MIEKVRFWVEETLEANRRDHTTAQVGLVGDQRGPYRSARALAMTMMAMQDAHAAVSGASTPYAMPPQPVPPGADADAAAAAAAHTVLQTLYPLQAALLWDRWQAYVARYGASDPSQEFGMQVGLATIAARKGDNDLLKDPPKSEPMSHKAMGPYEHDTDPLSPTQGFFGQRWGGASPFLPGLDDADAACADRPYRCPCLQPRPVLQGRPCRGPAVRQPDLRRPDAAAGGDRAVLGL